MTGPKKALTVASLVVGAVVLSSIGRSLWRRASDEADRLHREAENARQASEITAHGADLKRQHIAHLMSSTIALGPPDSYKMMVKQIGFTASCLGRGEHLNTESCM